MDNVQLTRPAGFLAIGVFFIFGASMAAYAAVTLFWPGTALDALWSLNRPAHDTLAPVGKIAGALFAVLCVALIAAATGWLRRRFWGWLLGVAIVAINAAGDLANLARGEVLKGAIGVVIAGLLLIYMTRRTVRRYFSRAS